MSLGADYGGHAKRLYNWTQPTAATSVHTMSFNTDHIGLTQKFAINFNWPNPYLPTAGVSFDALLAASDSLLHADNLKTWLHRSYYERPSAVQ